MSFDIDFDELLNQFSLKPRPYTAVADALDCQYRHMLQLTGLALNDVAPFDFNLLRTKPDGQESFRWIIGYDKTKFENILENEHIFRELIDLVSQNVGRRSRFSEYYKDVIKKGAHSDPSQFIAAIFHLTFRFHVPVNAFNIGRIHNYHRMHQKPYYRAISRKDMICDLADLPPLQIEGNSPVVQVSPNFFHTEYRKFKRFYVEWVGKIQGLKPSEYYDYIYNVYFPVYDGLDPKHSALRGYLGVYLKDKRHIDKVIHYFEERKAQLRNLSNAYKHGYHKEVVDGYALDGQTPDPIAFWKSRVKSLYHWGRIRFGVDKANDKVFSVADRTCKIKISKLLDRPAIRHMIDDELIYKYRNTSLMLAIPSFVPDELLSAQNSYLKKRFRDLSRLLDDIIHRRYMLLVSRKSAVAAVMARNESHNLGSHVFSRLCSEINYSSNGHFKSQSMGTFLSFIRTRKDFIADLSTNTPGVATSLNFYRDVIGYFRPLRRDEEGFAWQKILLDYVSGIEGLSSENILLRCFKDGREISLENIENDLIIASPNGLLGTHALYIILENIIRNCAKHGFRRNNRKLEITIQIKQSNRYDGFSEITVFDNLQNARNDVKSPGGPVVLVDYLNQWIRHSILDNNGNLRRECWGVLEMKICAAYLRRISPSLLDVNRKPTLLKAVDVNGNLGYRFYLAQPRSILIIDDNGHLDNSQIHSSNLEKYGSTIQKVRYFKQLLNSNIQHFFVILVEPDEKLLELVAANRTALPVRILTTRELPDLPFPHLPLGQLKEMLELSLEDGERFNRDIWQFWIRDQEPDVHLAMRFEKGTDIRSWQLNGLATAHHKVDFIHELDPFKKYVVYDRHGEIRSQLGPQLNHKIECGHILYHEQVNFDTPLRLSIENISSNHKAPRDFACHLIESALSKIVVLDERIQEAADNYVDRKNPLPIRTLLKAQNIFIPERDEVDLDLPHLDGKILRSWLKKELPDTSMLVVHLGIMERFYQNDVKGMEETVNYYQKTYPNINFIIISGRGMPNEVRLLNTRFIQYSQVVRYLFEERSKFHLTKVLFASRRALV